MVRQLEDTRLFMNTRITFTALTDVPQDTVYTLFNNGFRRFHQVVDRFSRFKPDSELSKLNNSNGKETTVSKEFYKLVKFALKMADKTNGVFDPTVIDFLLTYGYNANYSFERLQKKSIIQKEVRTLVEKRSSYKEITLDDKRQSITLAKKQRLDLGSIGKGYAIDLAYNELLPLKNFVINAGGDVRAAGTDETQNPWLVGLNSGNKKTLGTTQLKNQALCNSGGWARKVKFFHHLINPKTGTPQDELQSVFVKAKSAMEADAWATALFALGANATRYIRRYNLSALIVHTDGNTYDNDFEFNNR